MSKYDSVKIYVSLPEDSRHTYVLSRYLIARMLSVAKIPHTKAVKIALNLKKSLVDQDQLSISQGELEEYLFQQMESKGFGNEYFERLKFVNRFYCEKRPLIITICGAPFTGKSTLAQQLASRCNLSNVLQTDLIYEMLKRRKNSPLTNESFLSNRDHEGRDLTAEYAKECFIVRQSLEAEIKKTVQEGKSLVMEGVHLDPGLYLSEFVQIMTQVGSETCSELLYIPVVVTADLEDHKILTREALSSTGCRYFTAQSLPTDREIVFSRLQQFQAYLAEYQDERVVHVEIGLSPIDEALDKLHDRFLTCIEPS